MVDQPLERLAAVVVAAELGDAEIRLRDVAGAPGATQDFDLKMRDGRVVALEVTAAVHSPWVQLANRVAKQRFGPAPALSETWFVRGPYGDLASGLAVTPDIRHLRAEAPKHLRALEDAGLTKVDDTTFAELHTATSEVQAALLALGRLGINYAARRPLNGPDQEDGAQLVLLGPAGYSGFATTPEAVNQVVEHHVCCNLDKLKAAGGDERHLFVWADASATATSGLLMKPDRLPDAGPRLPSVVTTVWVGYVQRGAGGDLVAGLWRSERAGAWRQCRPLPEDQSRARVDNLDPDL